jgi:hypothetical protein
VLLLLLLAALTDSRRSSINAGGGGGIVPRGATSSHTKLLEPIECRLTAACSPVAVIADAVAVVVAAGAAVAAVVGDAIAASFSTLVMSGELSIKYPSGRGGAGGIAFREALADDAAAVPAAAAANGTATVVVGGTDAQAVAFRGVVPL